MWDEVIANNMEHMSVAVRWDVFEENFVSFLLEKMNFSNDLLNKINWRTFLTYLLEQCSGMRSDNKEVP